jgi:hypothetical protein
MIVVNVTDDGEEHDSERRVLNSYLISMRGYDHNKDKLLQLNGCF